MRGPSTWLQLYNKVFEVTTRCTAFCCILEKRMVSRISINVVSSSQVSSYQKIQVWMVHVSKYDILHLVTHCDRLCGLVVRILGYRSGGPGSIPSTTRKKSSGSGTGSTQPREYNWGATWEKSSGSCLENWEYGSRDPSRWPRDTLYLQNVGNHFADKRRSLDRYSSLADADHGVKWRNAAVN
jgi:hypothetical protein